MQCTSSSWASTLCSPLLKLSTSQKFAVASTQTPVDDADVVNGEITKLVLPSAGKHITSTSNPFVKHCIKLRDSPAYRRSHGSALVVGSHPIREISSFQESMPDSTLKIDFLMVPDKAEIPNGLDEFSACILRVSSSVMKKLSGVPSTDSIDAVALMKIPTSFLRIDSNQDVDCQKWFPSPQRILVLDGIQDPGNLGTLLRSAVAFGWGGVFLLPGCCDPFNEKALRASRGASFQLPIVSGGWIYLEALKNEFQMKFIAGHPNCNGETKSVSWLSQSLCASLSDTPLCLVLGSEGTGLSEKSQKTCELVSIPMAGEFESLNVSVAGGIFLYMLQLRK